MQPLTYSIAYGVIGGVIAYAVAHTAKSVLDWLSSKLSGCTGGSDKEVIVPATVVKDDFSVGNNANGKGSQQSPPVRRPIYQMHTRGSSSVILFMKPALAHGSRIWHAARYLMCPGAQCLKDRACSARLCRFCGEHVGPLVSNFLQLAR